MPNQDGDAVQNQTIQRQGAHRRRRAAVPSTARWPSPRCWPQAEEWPGRRRARRSGSARRTFSRARDLEAARGLPRLRNRAEYAALRAAFAAGCVRNHFRLTHYAVLNDHLHFVVEARDRAALSRGLQGLKIRIARALNKLWGRRGGVFADRYHDRILKTPRDVRNVLRYVLGNGRKHATEGREVKVQAAIDTYTSAPWFDGFREAFSVRGLNTIVRPVTDARTWMLRIGWRRHGLLSVHELPA
jgi:REP element-mobilizing transposase RayT